MADISRIVDDIEQEQRMKQLFRKRAEEGDGFAMIAYALTLVADSNVPIGIELSRLSDAVEEIRRPNGKD
jgi:hypothetical protein